MEKVEQDQHINNHDIGKELNIAHKVVLNIDHKTAPSPSFGEGYKKTRYLDVTWFNSEKFNGSNFHLQIIAKTEWNRTGFKMSHYGRWKMDRIRQ